ncbi:MAG: helix-turn-helix domain-containing protein [Edaphobacter sp.]
MTQPKRIRRTREVARDTILAAAEKLLISKGPQSLKLSDVAKTAKVVNATVIHHFGTIEGVQVALMERMVQRLAKGILAAESPEDRFERSNIGVPLLFDAFETRGTARLAAWLELTGEFRRLVAARSAMETVIKKRIATKGVPRKSAEDIVLVSVMMAMAVGLFGVSLTELLGRDPGAARRVALEVLRTHIEIMKNETKKK